MINIFGRNKKKKSSGWILLPLTHNEITPVTLVCFSHQQHHQQHTGSNFVLGGPAVYSQQPQHSFR